MKHAKTFTILCGVLALLLLVANFLPFWTFDGGKASIQGYVWFPEHYDALEDFLGKRLGERVSLNMQQVVAPILVLAATALCGFFCCVKADKAGSGIVGVICGVVCLVSYTSNALLRQGSVWWLHLLLSAGMIVMGLCANGQAIGQLFQRRKKAAA